MDRTYLSAHLRGPLARGPIIPSRWRRPGLVALLLLLAAGSTALWSSMLARFRLYHVAAPLSSGQSVHIAAWRPGPVYIPNHIDPATVRGRPTVMLWLQGRPAGTTTELGRIELPAWRPLVLTLSLALAALSIGLWPWWKQPR